MYTHLHSHHPNTRHILVHSFPHKKEKRKEKCICNICIFGKGFQYFINDLNINFQLKRNKKNTMFPTYTTH